MLFFPQRSGALAPQAPHPARSLSLLSPGEVILPRINTKDMEALKMRTSIDKLGLNIKLAWRQSACVFGILHNKRSAHEDFTLFRNNLAESVVANITSYQTFSLKTSHVRVCVFFFLSTTVNLTDGFREKNICYSGINLYLATILVENCI